MPRKNKGNYTDRDYSYNSRSRNSDSTRSFVFLDNKKRRGSGKAREIIFGIVFLLLVAGAVLLFRYFNK